MTDLLDTPTRWQPERDRYGRPRLFPPGETRRTAYTRATTIAGTLEDRYSLEAWLQRNVLVGASRRPDIVNAATGLDVKADRDQLNQLVTDASEAAGSSVAANTGTYLHALTEAYDRGELEIADAPEQWRQHLYSYAALTQGWEHLEIERLLVLDEHRIAGTPDRLTVLPGRDVAQIVDLKTGSIEYGMLKIAAQLAIYANADHIYDEPDQRSIRYDVPEIDLQTGIVIHLPADGPGGCRAVEVDLTYGWEVVQRSLDTRRLRNQAKGTGTTDVNLNLSVRVDQWIRRRVLAIRQHPQAAAALGRHWQPDYGSLSKGFNPNPTGWGVLELLEAVETEYSMPFTEPDPRETNQGETP